MADIDALIDDYRSKLQKIVRDMETIQQQGNILSRRIENLENLVDEEGNSPTGVAEPVNAENYKNKLENDVKMLASGYQKLSLIQSKLIDELKSLANLNKNDSSSNTTTTSRRRNRGGKKNRRNKTYKNKKLKRK